jgi:UDP-N-acetylmuramoylalanine--D-glutamate ligase
MSSPAFDSAGLERAYVLGLGLSGVAAARLLRSRGVQLVASDRRPAGELALGELAQDSGVELRLGETEPRLPAGADAVDAVVASPGVPSSHPLFAAARAAGIPVVAEVELAFELLEGEVVAITGSNGKSTTTAMTGALLAAGGFPVEVCGNIGKPLSAVVAGPLGRLFVVELSSFQLETIHRFRPRAAALLNLSPDHLDRHGDLRGYLASKQRIFMNQGPGDLAVLNADEVDVAATPTASRRRFFSSSTAVGDGCHLAGDFVVSVTAGVEGERLFAASDVPLPGPHNLENAMAAALLAQEWGIGAERIGQALRGFTGLPHRVQLVERIDGVAYFDDSKGTNVAATARSLESFADGSVHLVLGGRNKGADFAYLAEAVARKAVRIYAIGESAEAIAKALERLAPVERSENLENAVAAAAATAKAGEVVLLSPACASFDQFRDYIDRGEQFQRLVRGRSRQRVEPA